MVFYRKKEAKMIPGNDNEIKKEGGATFDCSTPENLDLQDKYSTYFSVYKEPITNKIPYSSADLQQIYEIIKGDSFAERTIKLRSFTNLDEAKRFKVYKFEYATFSGVFYERAAHRIIKLSINICIDLDHIGDSYAIQQIIKLILDKFPPALMFISPSGDGLKIVFKVNPENGTHSQYFQALQRFFADEIGFEIDKSGSDICRACFLPHDPDAYYNPDSDILDNAFIDSFPPVDGKTEIKHEKIQPPALSITQSSDEKINHLLTWLNKRERFNNGNRNNYVSKLAYACNRYGISENEALSKLLEFTETGFTQNEIRSITKSVYKHTEWHGMASFNEDQPYEYEKPEGHELGVAEVPPDPPLQVTPLLPITGFPFHIQSLILECARVFGTPRDFWAISFLQAIAIAVGCAYELKDKFTNGAVFWIGIVAPTGSGKSEPISIALGPIYQADSAAEKIYNDKMIEHEAVMNLSPKERKEQGIDTPEHPKKIQYIAVDSTPESLVEAHQDNPRGIAIVRDELVAWIADFGRYARSGEVQNMLSAWSEKFFKIIRKGKSGSIEKPFIPVLGGIQPAKLYMLAKDDRALDGFMQRFIFAYPDQCTKPDYHEESLGKGYLDFYQKYIETLLNLSGKRVPIYLSQEAKQVYIDFYNYNTNLFNNEANEYIKGVYQKLDIIVLRLALILHISNHVDDGLFDHSIQPEIMQNAIEMTEYFRITAKKVNQFIGNPTSETVKLDDRGVAQYLLKIGKITKSALADALGTSRSQLDRLIKKPGTVVQ